MEPRPARIDAIIVDESDIDDDIDDEDVDDEEEYELEDRGRMRYEDEGSDSDWMSFHSTEGQQPPESSRYAGRRPTVSSLVRSYMPMT